MEDQSHIAHVNAFAVHLLSDSDPIQTPLCGHDQTRKLLRKDGNDIFSEVFRRLNHLGVVLTLIGIKYDEARKGVGAKGGGVLLNEFSAEELVEVA